ncbi:MAG TPA: DinB family protein [Terriglobales bacterium]|nr:DinB family protein [Terriglobales bacterium]
MTLLDHLRHQFKYDSWANREQLRVLSELPAPPDPAVKLLTHIIAAQWLWLDRLQGSPQRTAVWPQASLSDCDSQLQELEREWQAYLGGLSEADLAQSCSYKNSRGEAWSNSVAEVLNQLILHAAHHRGQISLEIRRSGSTPAPVDYIHAVRKGLLA